MHSKKVRKIANYLKEKQQVTIFWLFRHIWLPGKVFITRRKKHIKVAFALASLGAWKTELLYKAMLDHPRFEPMLVIIQSHEEDNSAALIEYFRSKGYGFTLLSENETICQRLSPDIIFYQKPYEGSYFINHRYSQNRQALFCYITYSLRSTTESWAINEPLLKLCWQVYYENDLNLATYRGLNENHAVNGLATGLPVMDELLRPKDFIPDPWKASPGKKRIIFAPHHSINPDNSFITSTFLETGKLMLELAEKYSDRVQWAFKPHPLLRAKLEKYWGKDATDEYYERWSKAEWSQFEDGTYLGLFKHSDAMIHDCGSFTMEYIAMGNPVMYLMRSADVADNFNEMHRQAMKLHYHGYSRNDIEQFIRNVIDGKDCMKEAREVYRRDYLTPPGGRTACDNIIAAILG